MRGVQVPKRAVADYLAARLPAHLDALVEQWGVTLDKPEDYLPNEPSALDRFPLVAVSGVRVASVRRREVETEAPAVVYDVAYALRVFVWVRAQGVDRAVTLRDDLTAAVRGLLIANPTLDVPDEAVLIDEDSIVEEYSEPTPVKGDRVVAGSFVGVTVTCTERLLAGSLGTVTTTHARGVTLPHPALD